MQTKERTIAEVSESFDLQSLYSDVSFAINKAIEKNKSLEELLQVFRRDMIKIIKSLHEGPKTIPSAKLPRTLVPLIKALLTAKNIDYFDKIRPEELFSEPVTELARLKRIYQLCENEPFNSIMVGLHRRFKHEYFSRIEAEGRRINREERAICLAIDNPICPPEHKEKLKKELIELSKHAIMVRQFFLVEQEYFKKYRLNPSDVVYVVSMSFSFDSLRESAKRLLTIPSQQVEQGQEAPLVKRFKPQQR